MSSFLPIWLQTEPRILGDGNVTVVPGQDSSIKGPGDGTARYLSREPTPHPPVTHPSRHSSVRPHAAPLPGGHRAQGSSYIRTGLISRDSCGAKGEKQILTAISEVFHQDSH